MIVKSDLEKLETSLYRIVQKYFEFLNPGVTHKCDGRTDGETDRQTDRETDRQIRS